MSTDLNHEEMVARYLQQRAELASNELAKAADLITRFTDLAGLLEWDGPSIALS